MFRAFSLKIVVIIKRYDLLTPLPPFGGLIFINFLLRRLKMKKHNNINESGRSMRNRRI